jgi:UDP-N-acetylglucosamine transferase subunit ALG13
MGRNVNSLSQSRILGVDLLILVTLGTQDKSFVRLLEIVENAIIDGTIKDEVIVQAGYTKYKSDYMKVFDYIPIDEFNEYIKNSKLIITHGGVGSIMTGLKFDKKIIACPRLKKYKEHVNDHQLEIVEKLSKLGIISFLEETTELSILLEKLDNIRPEKFVSNNKEFTNKLAKIIEEI